MGKIFEEDTIILLLIFSVSRFGCFSSQIRVWVFGDKSVDFTSAIVGFGIRSWWFICCRGTLLFSSQSHLWHIRGDLLRIDEMKHKMYVKLTWICIVTHIFSLHKGAPVAQC